MKKLFILAAGFLSLQAHAMEWQTQPMHSEPEERILPGKIFTAAKICKFSSHTKEMEVVEDLMIGRSFFPKLDTADNSDEQLLNRIKNANSTEIKESQAYLAALGFEGTQIKGQHTQGTLSCDYYKKELIKFAQKHESSEQRKQAFRIASIAAQNRCVSLGCPPVKEFLPTPN